MPHKSVPAPGPEMMPLLEACGERLGIHFNNYTLLRSSLTHASGATTRLASNERLEFLGDAILGAVICDMLYRKFPNYLEGELTRIKSIVVSRLTCGRISKNLGLDEFLIVGKGVSTSPSYPPSLLSDVLESLIAAIYLDQGNDVTVEFIKKHFEPEIDLAVDGDLGINYKSLLQQVAQREHGTTPVYQLMDEKGPDHSKCFKISARIGKNRYQAAWGPNKKEAEQRAARNALSQLQNEDPPFPTDD